MPAPREGGGSSRERAALGAAPRVRVGRAGLPGSVCGGVGEHTYQPTAAPATAWVLARELPPGSGCVLAPLCQHNSNE